ncbi:hypothetical protein N0V83_001673 [Neocucurbitaria cava]|uniref:NAD(P)-binding protein n=1 Tax=Neocucurbitaria cava TaxID=798079 RepID=A0A9W9CRL1_9PLEO|nr:hypothetical protein N0V83_001673 [Neocucurbitaria cava]
MSVFRPNASALITGGASGIGLAVAQLCLRHDMKVTIVDFNQTTLDFAVQNLEKEVKGEVHCVKADVGDKEAWKKLREEGEGEEAIVVTGSKQGITNPPGNAAYNASKAAVKALTEHLSYDLREKKNIGVHLLVPGWTFTGLSGNVPGTDKQKPDGAWSPEQVADYMYKKMQDGKFYIICPDNDVSEETDKKRMLWSVGDIVNERPPLTRWRPEFKEEAEEWMSKCKV